MNHYELLCILSGKMTEAEMGECEKSIETMLKNAVSTLHYTHRLDRKKLAFPIDHHAYGYYLLAMFDAEPEAVSRIERELALMNDVLRHAVTQKKSVVPPPVAERKQSSFDALPSITEMPADMPLQQPVQAPQEDAVTKKIETVISEPVAAVTQAVQEPSDILPLKKTEMPNVAQASAPSQTPEETVQQPKKKQEKLSYEELDKRLDEIINNDIF